MPTGRSCKKPSMTHDKFYFGMLVKQGKENESSFKKKCLIQTENFVEIFTLTYFTARIMCSLLHSFFETETFM